ncbi:MAG: hypothetical protein M1820_008525 [Bogoriella megaspora]|nr:MAG: hypothetical protein M1820_008525 [Bogoriella megaspora]
MDIIANALKKINREYYVSVEPGLLTSQCRRETSIVPASIETTRIPPDQIDDFFRRCNDSALERTVGSVLVWVPLRFPACGGDVTRDIEEELINRTAREFHLGKTIDFIDSIYGSPCTRYRSVNASSKKDIFVIKGLSEWGALVWAFDEKRKTSRGIYIIRHDYLSEAQRLLGSLVEFDREPLFFALLPLLFSVKLVASDIDSIWRNILSVENRTGYVNTIKNWAREAEGDLASLSASTSGITVEITKIRQGVAVLKDQHAFLYSYNQRRVEEKEVLESADEFPRTFREITQCIAIAWDCAQSTDTRLDTLNERLEIQLTALFHLTQQQETHLGIQLAKESKAIAEASKKDSSAMKSLAAVTIVFLPGTSIASLFAMPFFQPDSNGNLQVNGQFWWYWVIVIPLTAALLLAWVIWIRRGDLRSWFREREDRAKISEKLE